MIQRAAKTRLLQLLGQFPAVALLGPRQVGKTTLALSLTNEAQNSPLYLDLELPSDRAKLADPELYLSDYEDRLVILDEIHRLPGIFQTLRSLIDRRKRKGKRTGQFLLLGSASIDLLQQSAETLAGRIAYMELTPVLGKRSSWFTTRYQRRKAVASVLCSHFPTKNRQAYSIRGPVPVRRCIF